MLHQSISPANIRIANRQAGNRITWNTDPWLWYRLIFLSQPEQRGGCDWCGSLRHLVVCHPADSALYRVREIYVNFRACGCYTLCTSCANAERQNRIICPRCRQQGHYVPAGIDGKGDGEVCWSCKPQEQRERAIFRKEQRNRDRNKAERERRQRIVPHKRYDPRSGTWIRIGGKRS